jgi:hypothetical protein
MYARFRVRISDAKKKSININETEGILFFIFNTILSLLLGVGFGGYQLLKTSNIFVSDAWQSSYQCLQRLTPSYH